MKKYLNHFAVIFLVSSLSFSLGAIIINNGDTGITIKIVKDSGTLIGLQFSNAEIDSMLDGLSRQKKYYQAIRNFHLDNSVMPAVLFNPIPNAFINTEKQKPLHFSNYSNTRMPVNRSDLAFYSIGQLAYLLKTRQISSVELTKFFINRLNTYDPKLKCVITITKERALKEATQADKDIAEGHYKGLLQGIPYGVKDLLSAKDYKTTWGAMPCKDQVINEDAEVIKKLHKAGAVLIVKLTMGALAMGDIWFGGQTKDPWDTTRGSSGSSAGPAAATSAGLVPFAIGTETWGSIVSPATVCGVTGLRPTYGRVSRTGAMALSWSMDKIGPICRNAEDCAIVFNAIYGPDGKDQTLFNYPFNYDPEISLKGMRIGYLKKNFDSDYRFHTNDSLALEELRKLGAVLVPVELPDVPSYDISIILDAEAAAAFDQLTLSGRDSLLVRQDKEAWPNIFRTARFIPAVEYINANRIRTILINRMFNMMKDLDLYISPSWKGSNLLVTNLTGNPCMVVPDGFTKDGKPTSITFIGKLFDEAKIIAVAKAYQDATGFQLKHPLL